MPSHTERRRTRMGQNELSLGKLCPQRLGERGYPRLTGAGLTTHELHLLVIDVDAVQTIVHHESRHGVRSDVRVQPISRREVVRPERGDYE